jgi:hypothetical protein
VGRRRVASSVVLRLHGELTSASLAGSPHTPLITTLALFVFFGAASVAFRQPFANKRRRAQAPAQAGEGGRATGEEATDVPVSMTGSSNR